jgi:deoxyribonuclease V
LHPGPSHRWDLSPREAVALQKELASQVSSGAAEWGSSLEGLCVAGADVSCQRGSKTVRAAVVVVELPAFEVVDAVRVEREAMMPYVPGLLSFREAPSVIEAFGMLPTKLRKSIDALICDGQGLAHPRGLGLASHIGLWLGIPTVGCAKSRLCGEHAEPGPDRGDFAPLELDGRVIGRVLRTRDNVKPLFVSVGHLIDLEGACDLVLGCGRGLRLPEPTRLAHHAAGWRGGEGELVRELERIAARGGGAGGPT